MSQKNMSDDEIKKLLEEAAGEANVKSSEPLCSHTTFRIGGPARFFVLCQSEDDLKKLLRVIKEYELEYFLLGGGSNVLAGDGQYDGVVIRLCGGFMDIAVRGQEIWAGGGVSLYALARAAAENGLSGLEFAHGIPGSLGGAVFMNAGAYGGEMKDVIKSARVLFPDGSLREMDAEELELSYRKSSLQKNGGILMSACLLLCPGEKEKIFAVMDGLMSRRKEKQPLEYPSAGSTFKRPEGYFAGKLIEEAGLSGYAVGEARVSEKHCGFVINSGKATAADVMAVCRHVQECVLKRSGVELEMEVRLLGIGKDR